MINELERVIQAILGMLLLFQLYSGRGVGCKGKRVLILSFFALVMFVVLLTFLDIGLPENVKV